MNRFDKIGENVWEDEDEPEVMNPKVYSILKSQESYGWLNPMTGRLRLEFPEGVLMFVYANSAPSIQGAGSYTNDTYADFAREFIIDTESTDWIYSDNTANELKVRDKDRFEDAFEHYLIKCNLR